MQIKGILVTMLAPMSDHMANAGEKILGNASSIKQRPDGRVYISGQKQRHALFSALDRLNQDDPASKNTNGKTSIFVSNGDGVTTLVETDIRADLGGFLDTSKGSYSGRRTAPLTATPGVALQESQVGRDLLLRLSLNPNGIPQAEWDRMSETEKEQAKAKGKEPVTQAIATREYSQDDVMLMNFFIDVSAVSIRKRFVYKDGMHLDTQHIKHVEEKERRRRISLAIEATSSLTDYANQARNAVSGEPQQVLIVFDTKLSRKACRYFRHDTGATERTNIISELQGRSAVCFFGDDVNGGLDHADGSREKPFSVAAAYKKAIQFLSDPANTLYDPAGGDDNIRTTDQFNQAQ